MKKLALLALAAIGLLSIAAAGECVLLGVTVTEINGKMYYAAEIRNDTTANMLNHKFAVGFIDASNGLAATKTVDGCLRSWQAGASDFFSANSNLGKTKVKTGLSRPVGPLTFGQVVNGDLTFTNIRATRNNETLVVTGRVTNADNDDLEDVRVCVVVRNNDGDVTVTERDNDTFDLNSNAAANFSITVDVPDDNSDVDEVDLWADATNKDESDDVTEPQSDLGTNVSECAAATNTPTRTPTGTATPTATNTPTATSTATATATNTAVPATSTPDDAC